MYHHHPAIHSLQLSLLAFQIVFPGTRLSESPVVGILTTGWGGIVEIFIGQRIYQNFLEIYAFIAKRLTSLKRIHTNCCFLLKVFRRHPFHRISRSPIHRRAWASEWRKSLGFRLHFVHII